MSDDLGPVMRGASRHQAGAMTPDPGYRDRFRAARREQARQDALAILDVLTDTPRDIDAIWRALAPARPNVSNPRTAAALRTAVADGHAHITYQPGNRRPHYTRVPSQEPTDMPQTQTPAAITFTVSDQLATDVGNAAKPLAIAVTVGGVTRAVIHHKSNGQKMPLIYSDTDAGRRAAKAMLGRVQAAGVDARIAPSLSLDIPAPINPPPAAMPVVDPAAPPAAATPVTPAVVASPAATAQPAIGDIPDGGTIHDYTPAMLDAAAYHYSDAWARGTVTTAFTTARVDRDRTAPAGLRGKARAIYVMTGLSVADQREVYKAERAGQRAPRAPRGPRDPDAVALAAEAAALCPAFLTPIAPSQARRVIDLIGPRRVFDVIGDEFITPDLLHAFAVDGDRTPEVMPVRATIRGIADVAGGRRVGLWGRKLGLLLLALHHRGEAA